MKKASAGKSQPDDLERAWTEQPETIRSFLDNRQQYEQLGSEVAYILQKRLSENNIEFSAVTCRAKTLKSFVEKLSRKSYDEPLREITDFAGVRVVYLYNNHLPSIEKVVESEFEIVEKIDKVAQQDENQFGYGALHYLVHLGRKSSGARYDDLKGLICEIQVRTVLQDAWAIIDHHLAYKQESAIPKHLRRKLNSLSGLFETADDQFSRIHHERESYKNAIKGKQSDASAFLKQPLDLDTFQSYIQWRFPQLRVSAGPTHLSRIFGRASALEMDTLNDLERLMVRTEAARKALAKDRKPPYGVSEIARALAFVDRDYREGHWSDSSCAGFEKYERLVEEDNR